jgi:hypothetical protein
VPPVLVVISVMTDAALTEENARLAETEATLADAVEAQRRLESIVSELHREKFGRTSEKLAPEQFNLPLEDVEIAQGVLEAAQVKERRALKGRDPAERGTPNRNRGHLSKHLARIKRIIETETTLWLPLERHWSERQWRRGCGEITRIGEDVSERLDMLLVRATLGNLVGRACFHLRLIVDHIRERLKGADQIFMDETRASVLDPGRRKTKTGNLWAIVADDRGQDRGRHGPDRSSRPRQGPRAVHNDHGGLQSGQTAKTLGGMTTAATISPGSATADEPPPYPGRRENVLPNRLLKQPVRGRRLGL